MLVEPTASSHRFSVALLAILRRSRTCFLLQGQSQLRSILFSPAGDSDASATLAHADSYSQSAARFNFRALGAWLGAPVLLSGTPAAKGNSVRVANCFGDGALDCPRKGLFAMPFQKLICVVACRFAGKVARFQHHSEPGQPGATLPLRWGEAIPSSKAGQCLGFKKPSAFNYWRVLCGLACRP